MMTKLATFRPSGGIPCVVLTLVFSLLAPTLSAQSVAACWQRQLEGANDHIAHSVAADRDSNSIVVGQIQGPSADLQDGNVLTTQTPGRTEFFMIKYDKEGQTVWAKNFGVHNPQPCPPGPTCIGPVVGLDVATHPDSNHIYAAGHYHGNVDFSGNFSGGPTTSLSSVDGFIIKYKPDGSYGNWAVAIGGSANDSNEDAACTAVAVDAAGNVYAAGTFMDDAHINTTANATPFLVSGVNDGATDIWIAKFDALANIVWVKTMTGGGPDQVIDLTLDSFGDVIAVGSYEQTVTLSGGGGTLPATGFNQSSMFIMCLNAANGVRCWWKDISTTTGSPAFAILGNSSGNEMNAVVPNDSGDVYVTGAYTGNITMTGTSGSVPLTGGGQKNVFVAKYDRLGALLWAKRATGPGFNTGNGIVLQDDIVYSAGRFGRVIFGSNNSTIRFDDGGPRDTTLTSFGRDDLFLSSWDVNGKFLAVEHFGSNDDDRIYGMALAGPKKIVVGEFEGDSLGFDSGDTLVNANAGINALVAAFGPDTSVVIKVKYTGGNDFGKYVELWAADGTTAGKRRIKELDANNIAAFTQADLVGLGDVEDVYLLDPDSLPMGRASFKFPVNNQQDGRRKEAIMVVHNDLVTYQNHPFSFRMSCWNWAHRYHYVYGRQSGSGSPGQLVPGNVNYYQTTLLVPPRDGKDIRCSAIRKDKKPLLFVHGYDGWEGAYWSGHGFVRVPWQVINPVTINFNQDLVDPQQDNLANNFNGKVDYVYTAYPARVAQRPAIQADYDVWEFYYPPDQAFNEAGYLLGQAIKKLLDEYNMGTKASVVAHSMGGLVTRSYIEGQATNCVAPCNQTTNVLGFSGDIDKLLAMGTPQHGSLLANRAFYAVGLPSTWLGGLIGRKDPCGQMIYTAGPGSAALEALNKISGPLPTNGVTYLQLSGTSFLGQIDHGGPDSAHVAFKSDESLYNEDGITAVVSGSLLNFGIDLALLEAFNHADLRTPENAAGYNVDPDILPTIIEDFILDGIISPATKTNLLQHYVDGANPQFPQTFYPANPTIGATQSSMNITAPMVSFRLEGTSDYWRPPGAGAYRFQAERLNATTIGLKAKPFYNWLSVRVGPYGGGSYLFYGQMDASLNPEKANLPHGSALFYPVEDWEPPQEHPLFDAASYPQYIHRGLGWISAQSPDEERDVYMGYQLHWVTYTGSGRPIPLRDWRYLRSTGPNNKMQLKWLQATYTDLLFNPASWRILENNEIWGDELQGSLSLSDFSAPPSNRSALGGSATPPPPPTDSLRSWVDCQVNSMAFVFRYGPNDTPLPIALESPTGDLIQVADTNGIDTLYHDDPLLRVRYFVIDQPAEGKWWLLVNGQRQLPTTGEYGVSYARNVVNPLMLEIDTTQTVADTAMIVNIRMASDSIAVNNPKVYAWFYNDSLDYDTLLVNDNGIFPDTLAGDSVYAGLFVRPDSRAYTIVGVMWGEMGPSNCAFTRNASGRVEACDLEANFESDSVCRGDTTFFRNFTDPTGIRSWRWEFGDGTTDSVEHPIHVYQASGTYHVKLKAVTNFGCVDTFAIQYIVYPDSAFPLTLSGPPALCTGDTLMLDAGPGFLTYAWNTGDTTQSIDVLSGGDFWVSVTSPLGCSAISDTTSVTVVSPPQPILTVTGNTTICPGESVLLDAGSGFSAYLWSNGDTNQTLSADSAGLYYADVFNGACWGRSDSVLVAVHPAPVVMAIPPGPDTLCDGDSLMLSASTGFSSYAWNNGDTTAQTWISMAGMYLVVATDSNGCIDSSNVVDVVVLPNPLVSFTGLAGSYVDNDPSVPLSGTPPGGTFSGPGVSGTSFDPATAGAGGPYAIVYTYTDSAGCTGSDTQFVTVTPFVGLAAGAEASLRIYPNPNTGAFFVEFEVDGTQDVYFRVADLRGKWLYHELLPAQAGAVRHRLQLPKVAAGVYFLMLEIGEQRLWRKFEVQ